jgi:UDP-glucuronate 4-epimerase
MKILVTGAAGFIGYHVSLALIQRGDNVVGIDSINAYYDVELKQDRLNNLKAYENFTFSQIDIADKDAVFDVIKNELPDKIIHLAAQAGVRHSIENPYAYIQSNILGHINILESIRHINPEIKLVYASSSSVYGLNEKQPFSTLDMTDTPISLYAATKKSDELMSYTYAHLYGIKQIGLRFFTVYGPYGRPDMAYFLFTRDILEGRPIKVFNHGKMKRDFTYIDDVVGGVISALDKDINLGDKGVPHKIYNLGNNKSETLIDFITEIEKSLGCEAVKVFQPMQDGDVVETYADISETVKDLNYSPITPISVGIPQFIQWYKDYYKV